LKSKQEARPIYSDVSSERSQKRPSAKKYVLRWVAILFCLSIWAAAIAYFIW
jgi:hypothetical protein